MKQRLVARAVSVASLTRAEQGETASRLREDPLDFVVIGIGYIKDAIVVMYSQGMLEADLIAGAVNIAEDE